MPTLAGLEYGLHLPHPILVNPGLFEEPSAVIVEGMRAGTYRFTNDCEVRSTLLHESVHAQDFSEGIIVQDIAIDGRFLYGGDDTLDIDSVRDMPVLLALTETWAFYEQYRDIHQHGRDAKDAGISTLFYGDFLTIYQRTIADLEGSRLQEGTNPTLSRAANQQLLLIGHDRPTVIGAAIRAYYGGREMLITLTSR